MNEHFFDESEAHRMEQRRMDKELLECAAKAAGHSIEFTVDAAGDEHCWYDNRFTCIPWRPLIDDGDAFRLAVKLRMRVDVLPWGTDASPWNAYSSGNNNNAIRNSECADDLFAAARLAITRAAAAIGRKL